MRFPEKQLRMGHEVLVKGVVLPDQKRQRAAKRPACASCLLPSGRNRARETIDDAGIQSSDIDSKLQRIGRADTQ